MNNPAGAPDNAWAALTVEELVETSVDRTVREGGRPAAGWALVDELQRHGPTALWSGAEVLLGPLSSRTVPGRDEREYVDKLRHQGRYGHHPVTALTAAVSADHRAYGTRADQEQWRGADDPLRARTLLQLLATYAWLIGGEAGTLSPAQAVVLIKATQIHPPAGR